MANHLFKVGDIVRYDGSHGDFPETGRVEEVEGDLLIVTSLEPEGGDPYREWDAHTCTLVAP